MKNSKGFTIVEILVVVVILSVVGLIIMMSVIPHIEKNAKESFVTDGILYLQAATKYFSDKAIEDEKFDGGCITIADLNKTDVGVTDKKNYKGYITVSKDENDFIYGIVITNQRFYSFNRSKNNYLVESSNFAVEAIMDNYKSIKGFPNKCPN